MTKEDLKAIEERVEIARQSHGPDFGQHDGREIVNVVRDRDREALLAEVLRLLAQEEARGETPEGDGWDAKANIDKRRKFSQLDLDAVTKPLHAEIERLKDQEEARGEVVAVCPTCLCTDYRRDATVRQWWCDRCAEWSPVEPVAYYQRIPAPTGQD